MRRFWPLLLVACSSTSTVTPTPAKDSGAPVDDEDSGTVEDGGTPPVECTEALSCFSYDGRLEQSTTGECAGHLYGCYGGRCPVGEVGTCVVRHTDSIENYAEACCANLACVRSARPGDSQCAVFDAGAGTGVFPTSWGCPSGTKPPGTCKLRSGTTEYCCAK